MHADPPHAPAFRADRPLGGRAKTNRGQSHCLAGTATLAGLCVFVHSALRASVETVPIPLT